MYHFKNILSSFGIIYFSYTAITATINYLVLPLLVISVIVYLYNIK